VFVNLKISSVEAMISQNPVISWGRAAISPNLKISSVGAVISRNPVISWGGAAISVITKPRDIIG